MSELKTNSVSLAEIISFIRNTQQTGRLVVKMRGVISRLFFEKGHIIGAQNDQTNGDDVIYQLFGAQEATFQFEKTEDPGPQTIDGIQELLILATLGVVTPVEQNTIDETTKVLSTLSQVGGKETLENGEGDDKVKSGEGEPSRLPPRLDLIPQRPKFKRRSGLMLPGGRPVSLPEAFRQMDTNTLTSLVSYLEGELFSGHLVWSGDAIGVLLFYEGKVIDVFWAESEPANIHGTLENLIERTNMDGPSNAALFALDEEYILAHAAIAYGEAYQEAVSIANISLARLRVTLLENKHSGAVRITNEHNTGYSFYYNGKQLGNYLVVDGILEPAYLRVEQLAKQAGSLIDVYNSPGRDHLLALAEKPKSLSELNNELREVARLVLGQRAQKVINILEQAGNTPDDLRDACERAKRVTKIFIDRLKYDELTRRMDQILIQLG